MSDDDNNWKVPDAPGGGDSQTDFVVDESGNIQPLDVDGFGRDDRFVLEIPSFWSGHLRFLVIAASVVYAGSVLPGVFGGPLTLFRLLGLVGLPLVVAAAFAYRYWKLPASPQVIEFADESVELPKGADSSSRLEVDYLDLRSVVLLVRGGTETVMVDTEGYRFTFSESEFRHSNGPRRFKEELMRRVRAHPESVRIQERMRAIEQRARMASENGTPATYVLLVAMLFGYGIEYVAGALTQQMELIRLGANSAPLIAEGQWWRLISGNFLHGGFLHIFLNGLALFFLGTFVEKMTGSWRFLFVFLATALGGAFGSYWLTGSHLSVGSSTALFGLVGAFGMLHLMFWDELPPPYRQTTTWWVVILGLNVGVSALPGVDAAAHGAGLVVGAVVYGLVLWPYETFDPTREASVWLKGGTAVLTAVFAAGLAMASNYAQLDHPGDVEKVYAYMVERGRQAEDPHELNRVAWMIATTETSTRSQLELARRTAEDAVDLESKTMFRDTLATVLYRIALDEEGDARRELLERAIGIEREILEEDLEPKGFWARATTTAMERRKSYRSQLLRFVDAYQRDFGRYTDGAPLPEGFALTLERAGHRLALSLEVSGRLERSARLLAFGFDGPERVAAFDVCIPAGAKGGVVERFGSDRWSTRLDAEGSLRVVLSDTEGVRCADDEVDVDYWRTAPSVGKLP